MRRIVGNFNLELVNKNKPKRERRDDECNKRTVEED